MLPFLHLLLISSSQILPFKFAIDDAFRLINYFLDFQGRRDRFMFYITFTIR